MKAASHRLEMECLEDRIAPAWFGVPPPAINPPAAAKTVKLNANGDAGGQASIQKAEVDWFTFIAPLTQTYTIRSTTPNSNLNTVLGVFAANGWQIDFNDDMAPGDRDSQVTVSLAAGEQYFFGITKYARSQTGSYRWRVESLAGDDIFEENDNILEAADLGTLTGPKTIADLVLADTQDLFRFTLANAGGPGDFVRIRFIHQAGNLDLALYDGTGLPLDESRTFDDEEQLSLEALPAGDYLVQVFGAKNPHYLLDFSVPELVASDDGFEDNDAFSLAADLGTLTTSQSFPGLQLNDSQDWYQFTMNGPGTATSEIRIQFEHDLGDIDLAVYTAGGTLVGESLSATDEETVSLTDVPGGTYFVRVYGFNGAFNPSYSLDIDPGVPVPGADTRFDIELVYHGFTPSQIAIFEQAVDRWEEIITGDIVDETYASRLIDDLLIQASAVRIDGVGRILGQAMPTRTRDVSHLPFLGLMEFDKADLAEMELDGTLEDVILHEITHVLGFGTLWFEMDLMAGFSNPVFTGPQAVAEYNDLFNVNATGVPVSNDLSHWREWLFGSELMTPFIDQPPDPTPLDPLNPLSRITVAALADMGYSVDLDLADPYFPLF